jgi:AraC family ethanolamine operon transcriptional activator
LAGRSVVTPLGDLHFAHTVLQGGIRTRGTQLDRITLGLQIGLAGSVSQWDLDVRPGDVFVLPPGIERDGCAVGDASFAMLSLYSGTLARLGGPDVAAMDFAAFKRPQRFRPEPRLAAELVGGVRALARRLERTPPSSPAQLRMMERSVLLPYLLGISFDGGNPPRHGFASGSSVIRRAEEWIDMVEPEDLCVTELAIALGVPLRSLQRAFHEAVGIGPASYLRRRRFIRVHAALATRSQDDATVTEVALAHGFWDLGRFAVSYRRMFGEKPSDTLRRGRAPSRTRTFAPNYAQQRTTG